MVLVEEREREGGGRERKGSDRWKLLFAVDDEKRTQKEERRERGSAKGWIGVWVF